MSEGPPQLRPINAPAPRNPVAVTPASTVSSNGGTLTDSNFNVPVHLQSNAITRHFSVNFNGSLSELAAPPRRAAWSSRAASR